MKLNFATLLFGLSVGASAAPASAASQQEIARRQLLGGQRPQPKNNPFQTGKNPAPQAPANPFQSGRNPPPQAPGKDPFQSGGNPPPQAPGNNPFQSGGNPPPQAPSNPFQQGPRPVPKNGPGLGNPLNPSQGQPSQPGPAQGQPAIENAIKSTGQALEALYNELKGWNRLPKGQESPAVKRAYDFQDRVVQEMRRGAQDIRGGGNVASAEATRMRDWLGAVTDLFSDSMDQWIEYKRFAVAANARANVYQQLRDLQTALNAWNEALVLRLPTLSTVIQGTWRARQRRQIERAVSEYRQD